MKNRRSIERALTLDINIGGTGLTAKALLAKHLAILLRAGLSIGEALDISSESATGKLKKILGKVRKSVESGRSLSDSLSDYPKVFTGIFISAVYAGETSGTLDKNLENLSEQLEKERELNLKIKSAVFYPAVVLTLAMILGLAVSFFVLPQITPLFSGLHTELPATTKLLIAFSNLIKNHGPLIFWILILSIIFFIWLFKQKFFSSISHGLLLGLPVIGRVAKNSNLASFCRTFSLLLKSGLTIDEAVCVIRNITRNFYYKKSLTTVCRRIGKGAKLNQILAEYPDLFPVVLLKMIRVGEESGDLEASLDYLSLFYEKEVDASTKTLTLAIEPTLLLIIGLVVGFLAVSIITPIYSITGSIHR